MRAISAASLRSRSASTAFDVGTRWSGSTRPAQTRWPLQVMLSASSPMRVWMVSTSWAALRWAATGPISISTCAEAPAPSSCSADWVR
jgi:hypothetical protein